MNQTDLIYRPDEKKRKNPGQQFLLRPGFFFFYFPLLSSQISHCLFRKPVSLLISLNAGMPFYL